MPVTNFDQGPVCLSGSTAATSSEEEFSGEDEKIVNAAKNGIEEPSCRLKVKNSIASFQSCPEKSKHERFLRDSLDIILRDAVFRGTSRSSNVLEWNDPGSLAKTFDFGLEENGETHERLLSLVEDTIRYSVKPGHPYFVNQLFSSLDPYGLVGQWVTDSLNPSVYTYEVSPVFSLMEEVVLSEMRRIVGYQEGTGDGIFCPGGSMANGYAINCARFRFNPQIKETGLHGLPRLVLFTSEDAHYSMKKLASFLGIGSNNVYSVKTDEAGKMSPDHLQKEIERATKEGATPFMVCATAGTTVLGAFDPLEELAEICERQGLWFHVDAAWGGGALISKRHRHLMRGIHRADSVTWNPHKMLACPQQCSTLLLKDTGILAKVHSTNAAYLFQKDKFYDTSYDTGDKHVQCGRRVDVYKFWLMWKAKGTSGLEKHVDKVFENSRLFAKTIRNRPGFEMVLEDPECTNVCFWYVPLSMRSEEPFNIENATQEFKERLHKVAPKMKERMMKQGTMMVTYQPLKSHPNFFRIVFQNSSLERSDILHLVDEFERLGKDL